MKRTLNLTAIALGIVFVATLAVAQTGPTNSGSTGLFSLTTGDTLPQGEWSVGWYANNWDLLAAPSLVGGPGPGPFRGFKTLAYDRTEMSLSLGYGLTDRFELSLAVPWVHLDEDRKQTIGQIDGIRYSEKLDESGVGPLRLRAKFGIWDSEKSSSRLSLFAGVDIPTESENTDDPIQTGKLDYQVGAAVTARYLSFSVGYLWRGDRGRFQVPGELRVGFGFDVPATSHMDLIGEVTHVIYEDTGSSPVLDARPDDQTHAALGIRYFVNDVVALNAGLRTNLTIALGGNDGRGHQPLGWVAGVSYYPWTKGRRQTVIEGYGWVKKTPPPPPVITSPVDGATVTNPTVGVMGTALPGATVHLSVDGGMMADLIADQAGSWQTTVGLVTEGAHAAAATQTDPKTKLTSEPSPTVHFDYEKPLPPQEPVVKVKTPEAVMKDKIYFEPGSAKLTNIAKAVLDQAALRIKSDESATATVVGYSDGQGPEAKNMEMSEKRAEAARDYLVERHGIDASRISVEGRGSADPEGDNATKAGRKLNRRVEITVTVMR